MAAANESQGLKIAVAAFITLTVALAVTCYFLYSAYDSAAAKSVAAAEDATKKARAADAALSQYSDLRAKVGTRAEEADAAKEEISAHQKKIGERVDALLNATNTAIQKAQTAGASGTELDEIKGRVNQIVGTYRSEPNKTYISSLDRLAELMESTTTLLNELSLNYADLRHNLESSTTVAKQQNDVHAKAATDSRADLENEHKKHESDRGSLLTKVDQLQTDNNNKATEIANLSTKIKQMEEDFGRQRADLTSIIRETRDKFERSETILDRPDGYVKFVDLTTNEVHINVTRRQGARPQMTMSVFDANSPGIPTDRPKGSIRITKVGDDYSVAQIVKTVSPIDPIRDGDIVYSAAWSPNNPMQFALIGKMDVNRDGKDDRQELKRMIEDAGGIVAYDLPPIEVGKESGKMSARIDWYVTDNRIPLRDSGGYTKTDSGLKNQSELQARMGDVIKEARLEGVRPMEIGKLLNYLGYDYTMPVVGRVEGLDDSALRRMTAPKAPAIQPAASGDTSKAAQPKSDEMKDEPK
jgi:peptidoglycan hydrolase CwlO-like protein